MGDFFAEQLIGWHEQNPRELPWEDGPRDPYHIWISEIIMQQTRIAQGASYYHRFIERFPDVFTLADSPIEDVMHAWQGLGYYSRARNIHKAANQIVQDHSGILPDSFEYLLRLPGVGNYTAAAIASFGYNLPHAVVDGNVTRVVSRYIGITEPIGTPGVQKQIQRFVDQIILHTDPPAFNQAIMNFGALVCKPVNPDCQTCALQSKCYAYKNDVVGLIPIKKTKEKLRKRYFTFFVLSYKDQLAFAYRNSKDIWQQLNTFPLLEKTTSASIRLEDKLKFVEEIVGHKSFSLGKTSGQVNQLLSHQQLIVRFIPVALDAKPKSIKSDIKWLAPDDWKTIGKPKVITDYLKSLE